MHTKPKPYYLLWINLLVLITFNLTGCATRGTAIPQGGPSMAQIYEESMHQSRGETLDQARTAVQHITATPSINDNSLYTRNSENEISNLFPLLPNPQLVLYVYPHLAGNEQLPVPGYSTAFPLYSKLHYALPGER